MEMQEENKKTQVRDEKNTRIRAMIYPMAGFYLIYQAFCVYKDISAAPENQNMMVVVSAIFLAIAGIGMIILGSWIGYKSIKSIKRDTEEK